MTKLLGRTVLLAVTCCAALAVATEVAPPLDGGTVDAPAPLADAPQAAPKPPPETVAPSSLHPEGEKALLAPHPVDGAQVAFKPGKGLQVTSADDAFALTVRARVQILAEATDDGSEVEAGVMVRRARVVLSGHTFGKHNKYEVELAFSPRDLNMTTSGGNVIVRESPLLTWMADFDHLRDASVRVGQYKIPFSRQRVISSGNQQMVDRSIANNEFNLDRDIGVEVYSKDLLGLGLLRYHVGVYNGENRSAFRFGSTDFLYLGRVEVLPLGFFNDYSEGDFERLAKPGLSIGLGYAFAPNAGRVRVNQGSAPADGGTSDFHTLTADVMAKWQGVSLSGEFFWRNGGRHPGGAVTAAGDPVPVEAVRKGVGWFAQVGYLLPRLPFEVAARVGQVVAAPGSSLRDRNEAGVAASFYPGQHSLKVQADYFRLWGPGDGENQFRVQVQVAL